MPIKRTAEELERPPLPRGSACHRCFARKVRCSGQPDPGSGVFGCSSCLRTARHRGHDVAQVKCAFEREGLCSEEGGLTLDGQVLAGSASTGPARRQRPSARSAASSSTNSLRSTISTSSSARTDSYSTDASSIAPSTANVSPGSIHKAFPSELPSPPANFQYPAHFSSLPPLILPTSVPLSSEALSQLPDPPQSSTSELPTPIACTPMQSLLHRRANAPQRQLSLSADSTPSDGSPYPSQSPYLGNQKQQASAPLMAPPSWAPPSHPHYPDYSSSQHPLPQYYFDGPLPNTSFALDLAPFSALTPSTLAKMNLTPTSSYNFPSTSSQVPSGITQPSAFSPNGVAFTGGSEVPHPPPSSSHPGDASFASSLSGYASTSQQYPQHPPPLPSFAYPPDYTLPLAAPATYYPQYSQNQHDGGSAQGYSSSFHLPSPGVTFSSSLPPGFREEPRNYFDAGG